TGALARSSISFSRSACSSSESHSFRVELRNCASTTRWKRPPSGRTSELPAHRVQIVCDTDEPRGGPDQGQGCVPAQMAVPRREPQPRLASIASDERVQAAEDAEEEERMPSLGGRGRQ